ncbi:hypothetical protein [Delftia tsuruhatensis]|uniref:Uncharacterized protein n=1 Tax=Delftia tsuruhatensis TaxID=180282 RepID=A0ABM6E533_9BURK|nr:hypothetical protein [Delftia tsuruhatensis]AOV02419.1 hypothetical protein BI380_14260 [Delftia tsuruhatensis]
MKEKTPEAPRHEQDLEFAAQLAAQGRLLGQLYAVAFEGRPDELKEFMRVLIANTARLPIEGGGSQEDTMELKARINVHLERFEQLTVAKIRRGRGTSA